MEMIYLNSPYGVYALIDIKLAVLLLKRCEVRDLNPRSRAWEARTLTVLG